MAIPIEKESDTIEIQRKFEMATQIVGILGKLSLQEIQKIKEKADAFNLSRERFYKWCQKNLNTKEEQHKAKKWYNELPIEKATINIETIIAKALEEPGIKVSNPQELSKLLDSLDS